MAKILFIVPDRNDPTSFYRASGISRDLEKKSGFDIAILQWNEINISWQTIASFDLVMLQRPFTKTAADLCSYIKLMQRPLWVDYDDNLFALNPENKAFNTYNDPDTQENIKSCLKQADVVTVPTEYLRQSYTSYNKNILVVPNAFNDDLFKRADLPPREKKVIWRGPESHIYDIMSFGPEVNRATTDFPEWEFIFMGFYPWFLANTPNKGFIQGLDIILYYKKLFELKPAAAHILLHDNTFNRCRSNIGYIEASWAGAVSIVPAWWNVPGALAYSNPEEYYQSIKSLLGGEVDTEAYSRMAWEYVQDCLALSKVNVMRLNLLNELL